MVAAAQKDLIRNHKYKEFVTEITDNIIDFQTQLEARVSELKSFEYLKFSLLQENLKYDIMGKLRQEQGLPR